MYYHKQQKAAGILFIRALLGTIFFLQGYGKIFTIGLGKLYEMFFSAYELLLPKWALFTTLYFTSYVEMIAGFLLIFGLFKKQAMYLLALDLLLVSIGHGIQEPIWDLQHVFPRAILLAALLLLPQHWDKWKLDKLFRPGHTSDDSKAEG